MTPEMPQGWRRSHVAPGDAGPTPRRKGFTCIQAPCARRGGFVAGQRALIARKLARAFPQGRGYVGIQRPSM